MSSHEAANSGAAALICAEDVHKSYLFPKKQVQVLRGAALSVAPGETVAIVGASGAGKSTLLHILGGLDRPDEGRVLFDGGDYYALRARRRCGIRAREIGFVFQSYHLLPEMDVLENVMLPAMALSRTWMWDRELRARALSLLARVGLADRADHTPLELSGGEQQRVALARALMNGPRLILADEPTGNLDGDTGQRVLANLFALTQESDKALVLVTHDEAIASSCGRVLRLCEGVLGPA